jgi:hypothetical protein
MEKMEKFLVRMERFIVRMEKFTVKMEKIIVCAWQNLSSYLEAVPHCL